MSYLACAAIIAAFIVAWFRWRAVMAERRRTQMEEASNSAAHFQSVKREPEDAAMIGLMADLQRRRPSPNPFGQ